MSKKLIREFSDEAFQRERYGCEKGIAYLGAESNTTLALQRCGLLHDVLVVPKRNNGLTSSGKANQCHGNVLQLVKRYGGKKLLGYRLFTVTSDDTHFVTFSGHSVWLTPEGKAVCVTHYKSDDKYKDIPRFFIPIMSPQTGHTEVREWGLEFNLSTHKINFGLEVFLTKTPPIEGSYINLNCIDDDDMLMEKESLKRYLGTNHVYITLLQVPNGDYVGYMMLNRFRRFHVDRKNNGVITQMNAQNKKRFDLRSIEPESYLDINDEGLSWYINRGGFTKPSTATNKMFQLTH